jgi:IS30 family transposase
MSYKQLTQDKRYQLYLMNEMGYLQKTIALILGTSASTICRELKRNVGKRGRYIKKAHKLALQRRDNKSKSRITASQWQIVEYYIRQDFSPEQVSGWLKRWGCLQISHAWIYQYIRKDKQRGGTLHTHLRCKKKNRKWHGKERYNQSLRDRISITERPEVVNTRQRYGDWEVDTVIGRPSGKVLVTLVERKSKLSVIGLSINKTAQAVKDTIISLLRSLSSCVHTLTYDNGPEFAQHVAIDKVLKSQAYFARPYCSGDRGLNENTNGLIRQYLPKRSSFDDVSDSAIEWIMERLNNRPRKTLNGRTPNEVFFRGNRIALTS